MLLPDREPTDIELRHFAVALPLALCVLGGLVAWRAPHWAWATPLWAAAVLLGVAGVAFPAARRPIRRGFMTVTRPVGRVVSFLLLGAVYFGVLLPMGLASRAIRGDRLGRRFDAAASTHWQPHEPEDGPAGRFRPY